MFDKRIIWYAEQIYDIKISIAYSKDKTVKFRFPKNAAYHPVFDPISIITISLFK